jgi:hypothetical protein
MQMTIVVYNLKAIGEESVCFPYLCMPFDQFMDYGSIDAKCHGHRDI